jgi:hypothetical protein
MCITSKKIRGMIPGFELRALHLLGKGSTALATPPSLSALMMLELGSHFAQAKLDHDPSLYASPIAGKTDARYHTLLFLLSWSFMHFSGQVSLEL